jgi:hypothetical protein
LTPSDNVKSSEKERQGEKLLRAAEARESVDEMPLFWLDVPLAGESPCFISSSAARQLLTIALHSHSSSYAGK